MFMIILYGSGWYFFLIFSLFFITIDNLDECGVVGIGACYAALAWNIQHTDCQCYWRTWKAHT
jgi:hypothetical protein